MNSASRGESTKPPAAASGPGRRAKPWLAWALGALLCAALAGVGGFSTTGRVRADTSGAAPGPEQAGARVHPAEATSGAPAWLEPRGLSVVELVGRVPEETLHGMIVAFEAGCGIAVYESGSRVGDTVVVTATLYPRLFKADWAPNQRFTRFSCLGQTPYFDHMGTVVSPSTLRVYDSNGAEVTSEIQYMRITRMGLSQPLAGSQAWARYPMTEYGPWTPNPLPMGPDGLELPDNAGCEIVMPGPDYPILTGVFTFSDVPVVPVSVVGVQQASFRSYIGPGDVGLFAPLMQQMRNRYPDRHGRITLQLPAGANSFLLKYPPMPADPYSDLYQPVRYNLARPVSGTYRLSTGVDLSADLTYSAAFPLDPAWRDADQSPGAEFLPLIWHPSQLAPLEYVVPAGMAYHSCFTQGNCSDALLQQIYDAVMTLQIVYLQIGEPVEPGEWASLKMAGPAWSPGLESEPGRGVGTPAGARSDPPPPYFAYLPLVARDHVLPDPVGCPCGWFDPLGRMLDSVPSGN